MSFTIEVKRFYMPAKCEWTCECGHENVRDLSDNYISYPKAGEWESLGVYCDSCEEEPDGIQYKLTVGVEFRGSTPKTRRIIRGES